MDHKKIFTNLPEIRTKRLVLRKLRLSDAADIFEYAKIKRVSKYTLWEPHKSVRDTEKYLKFVLSKYRRGEPMSWAITLKDTGKVIGTAGIEWFYKPHMITEIGYALAPAFWNKGYMTEAVKAVIGFAFKILKVNRVEASCDRHNIASSRVMEKCGMKYEGLLRKRVMKNGKPRDCRMFAITRKGI